MLRLACCWSVFALLLFATQPVSAQTADDVAATRVNVEVARQKWLMWIEAQKADVLESMIETREVVPGTRLRGEPLIEFRAYGDSGLQMAGDVQMHCASASSDCRYRVRDITIPISPYTHELLARFAEDAFDAEAVTENLKVADLPPGTNLWHVQNPILFADLPRADAILRDGARIVIVDSADCPAVASAIDALEGETMSWPVDFSYVGEDQEVPPPRPHSSRMSYKINMRAEGGSLTLEGGSALWSLVQPVLQAASVCRGR